MLALLFPLLLTVSSPGKIAPVAPEPRTGDLGQCYLRQLEPVESNGRLWLVFDCPESGAIVLRPSENFQVPAEKQ